MVTLAFLLICSISAFNDLSALAEKSYCSLSGSAGWLAVASIRTLLSVAQGDHLFVTLSLVKNH